MSRTKKGVSLINKNVGKFQSIIKGLEKGVKLCEKDIVDNEGQIQVLTDENAVIEESRILASTFKVNLSNMLKVPTKVISDSEKDTNEEEKED